MAAESRFSWLRVIWSALLLGAIPGYSLYLDFTGLLIEGRVSQKDESFNLDHGDWSRRLSVTATYLPSGESLPSYAYALVDPDTYDRLRIGSPVTVRYLASRKLRQIPLLKTARFADRWTFSLPKDYYPGLLRGLGVAFGAALLAFLWRKAGIAAAGWLLIPYLPFLYLYFTMPRAEPAPSGPRITVRAKVERLVEVTEILDSGDGGFQAAQPYQAVQLRFQPRGFTEPVTAVDKIDSGSVPGLVEGGAVEIEYQAARPRVVSIRGASRTFPRKSYEQVSRICSWLLLGLAALGGAGYWLHSAGRGFFEGLAVVIGESLDRRRR